ncbi:MAG: hypothetical protein J0L84_09360 [Verrucomicrobia bacterium]|nr:hypothetical protein [Verrucomicrobiota bacterium]
MNRQDSLGKGVLPLLLALLLPGSLVQSAEPGSLDVRFDPPEGYGGQQRFLVVVGSNLYLTRENLVRRMDEQGVADPEWRLRAPLEHPPQSLVATPWGGFVVSDVFQSYLEQADGTWTRMGSSTSQWFPQADGSFIVHMRGRRISRQDPEGREVVGYGLNGRFGSVSFVNPSGSSSIGAVFGPRVAMSDRRGRLVVGGNFVSVGGVERLGLVRLLGDGRPDPAWNPGAALGIATTNDADPEILANFQGTPPTNFMTARPDWLILGPDDTAVVGIEYVAPRGFPDRRIAVLRESGELRSIFPSEPLSGLAVGCVQPDGRILIADHTLETWQGTPVGKLIRLEPDGTLDPTFQVTLDPPGASVSAMTLDDQGRLWISGFFTAVNGVARPGLARLFAHDSTPSIPQMTVSVARSRVAEGETLHLATEPTGSPAPAFQWYRDGVPIPGAVQSGLRLPVTNGVVPAEFQVVAWNTQGTNVLNLGRTEVAIRSPRPGGTAPQWGARLTNVSLITRLVPLADGRILFGAGTGWTTPAAMVGRLTAEGLLDSDFGTGGIVEGDGRVEDLLLRPDGSVVVTGSFSSIAGAPAAGIAELSATGQRIPRNFPELDYSSVTTALGLPNGQWILAGRFSRVAGVPRFRMARLKSDLSLDPDFDASATFERWQVVDVLALDGQGRLLAAGASHAAEGSLTNPAPYGLARLLPNGALDPTFTRAPAWGRTLFVESDGNLVTGLPLQRWSPEGRPMPLFLGNPTSPYLDIEPDHRLVRLSDGSFVAPLSASSLSINQLRRWLPNGRVDDLFENPFTEWEFRPRVTAAAALPDGSILTAIVDGRGGALIRRVLPDSDLQLADPQWAGGELRAGLFTQPGRRYRVVSRDSPGSPATATGELIEGDGYLSPVGATASGSEGYLQVVREPDGE